jgi:hypothetical protein
MGLPYKGKIYVKNIRKNSRRIRNQLKSRIRTLDNYKSITSTAQKKYRTYSSECLPLENRMLKLRRRKSTIYKSKNWRTQGWGREGILRIKGGENPGCQLLPAAARAVTKIQTLIYTMSRNMVLKVLIYKYIWWFGSASVSIWIRFEVFFKPKNPVQLKNVKFFAKNKKKVGKLAAASWRRV